MATRSTIAIENSDLTVDQIYCHWDGYLDNNGWMLYQHWQDPAKVRAMIDLGDLSSLGYGVGVQHDFDQRDGDCTFYGRDRDETGTEACHFRDFEDYRLNHQYEEFEYILRRDGHWYVCSYEGDYQLLADALGEHLRSQDQEEVDAVAE